VLLRVFIGLFLVLPCVSADRASVAGPAADAAAPPAHAVAAPAKPGAASPGGLLDLQGRPADPLKNPDARVTVLLFVRTDCPISNRYAPEVRRLRDALAPRGVVWWMIYPDPDETVAAIRKHLEDYKFGADALRDTRHALVKATGVTVTPEAAVFKGSTMIYRGRIDDRYEDLGKMRPEAVTHDLEDAIRAALAGKKISRRTRAVGCDIPELP
jgi:ribosomal protein L35AE/L33A